MRVLCALLFAVWCSAAYADEIDYPTYQSALNAISARKDCQRHDYAELAVFVCAHSTALWYFAMPGSAAYPGLVKRSIVRAPNGAVYAHEDGRSYGPDSAQPAFKKWMDSIVALDRKMKDEIEQAHAKHDDGQ